MIMELHADVGTLVSSASIVTLACSPQDECLTGNRHIGAATAAAAGGLCRLKPKTAWHFGFGMLFVPPDGGGSDLLVM
jgi:hypothetical protein